MCCISLGDKTTTSCLKEIGVLVKESIGRKRIRQTGDRRGSQV